MINGESAARVSNQALTAVQSEKDLKASNFTFANNASCSDDVESVQCPNFLSIDIGSASEKRFLLRKVRPSFGTDVVKDRLFFRASGCRTKSVSEKCSGSFNACGRKVCGESKELKLLPAEEGEFISSQLIIAKPVVQGLEKNVLVGDNTSEGKTGVVREDILTSSVLCGTDCDEDSVHQELERCSSLPPYGILPILDCKGRARSVCGVSNYDRRQYELLLEVSYKSLDRCNIGLTFA